MLLFTFVLIACVMNPFQEPFLGTFQSLWSMECCPLKVRGPWNLSKSVVHGMFTQIIGKS